MNAKNANGPSGPWAGGDPMAVRRSPFASFAFFAVPLLLAHSWRTEGENGASRGVPAPAEFRVGWGAVQWRRAAGLGLVVAARGRLGAVAVPFCEIAQQPRPPPGQARLVGSDPGGATTPGKDRHGSRWARFLRNRATTPAFAGTGSSRRGRLCRRTRSGRVRRPGHRTGEERAQVVADVVLRNRATTPAFAGAGSYGWGRLLPLGSLRAGAPHRGRTGAGRGGRFFAKSRIDPPAGTGSCRWARSGRVRRTGEGPHRRRTGAGRGGRGFAKSRNDPRVNRRGQFSCIGVRRHATQRDGPWGNRCRTHHRLPCSGLRGRAVEPGAWAIRIDPRLVYVPRGLSLKLHPMAIGLTYPPGNPTPRGRMIAIAGPHHNGVPNA
jgi:hypothetical protein